MHTDISLADAFLRNGGRSHGRISRRRSISLHERAKRKRLRQRYGDIATGVACALLAASMLAGLAYAQSLASAKRYNERVPTAISYSI